MPGKRRTVVLATALVLATGACAASRPAAATRVALTPSSTTTTLPPRTSAPTTSVVPLPGAAPPTITPTTSAPATTAAPSTTGPACAPSLAAELASTGGGAQVITVESAAMGIDQATITLWDREGACWVAAGGPWSGLIGANGFSDHHVEGDNTTPTGIYGIGPVMYGNVADPGVAYAYHQLVCGDWWDEDPTSPAYNTFQHVVCGQHPPFGGGSEALWTETAAYPSFAVIDDNVDPVVAGAGSGIFLHADAGQPTAGCVSIPLTDLDTLLRALRPDAQPHVVMGPAAEITRF